MLKENNNNKISGIYKLTSPSGKIYIGQSKDLDLRISKYRSGNCKNQYSINKAIIKYGFENFIIEYIFVVKYTKGLDDLLNYMETKYIKEYNCMVPLGYNLTSGGGAHTCSELTKSKMSAAATGRKYSDESKLKMSLSKKGKPIHTPESKQKLSLDRKGVPYSKEIVLRMGKPIICPLLYGIEFHNIKEASKCIGVYQCILNGHLKRNNPSNINGLTFRYK